jgi:hypothetical protein
LRTIFSKIEEEAQTGILKNYHIARDSWKGRTGSSWSTLRGIKIEAAEESTIVINFVGFNPQSG